MVQKFLVLDVFYIFSKKNIGMRRMPLPRYVNFAKVPYGLGIDLARSIEISKWMLSEWILLEHSWTSERLHIKGASNNTNFKYAIHGVVANDFCK